MALRAGALVLFGIFHFLPYHQDDESIGWAIWPELIYIFQDANNLEDLLLTMAVASFLTFTLLILTSPFLSTVWNKSKLAWSVALACSGLAVLGFWIPSIVENDFAKLLPGGWCLMFAPVLNFFGLLSARGISRTPALIPPGAGNPGSSGAHG
jgi:hypothetical protein